jgi:hypothetical protein
MEVLSRLQADLGPGGWSRKRASDPRKGQLSDVLDFSTACKNFPTVPFQLFHYN